MADSVHHEDASFLKCQQQSFTIAASDGGWDDETWARYLEERLWTQECGYKLSQYDFETPVYHLLSLAREGIDNCVERLELPEDMKTLLGSSVCIVNVDGSVDDECAPLTMTVKARIYSLGAPRSIEVRHEYHSRQGWEVKEYNQRVSFRLNHPRECGRRFMPPYKKDEDGWKTMFTAYLDYGRSATAGRNMGGYSAGGAAAPRGRGGRGRGGRGGRGRGGRGKRTREEELAEACDTDGGTETGDSKGGVVGDADDEAQVSGPLAAGAVASGIAALNAADSSGGTAGNGASSIGAATAKAGVVAAAAAGGALQQRSVPSCTLRQKWIMSADDLDSIRDQLLAGSQLEEDLGDYELLELLLASVGICNGKVAETEVGKPMYGKPFIEHHKRRLGGGGAGMRSGAGSLAVSEESGEAGGDGGAHGSHHHHQQGGQHNPHHKRARMSDSGRGGYSGGGAAGGYGSDYGGGQGYGAGPAGYGVGGPQYGYGGHGGPYEGQALPGLAGSAQLLSRLTAAEPYMNGGAGRGGSRVPTPTGSLSSWGGAARGSNGSVQGMPSGEQPERNSHGGSSRRKRGGGSRGNPASGLPPLVPSGAVGLRSKEVEAL